MDRIKIACIIPTYTKFRYALQACQSFFSHTEGRKHLFVVDDASPEYPGDDWRQWRDCLPAGQYTIHRFAENGGLTRSWNWGLRQARDMGCEFTVCTNSDILFTPHWQEGLLYHLNRGYKLVAPVTNAPGPTNRGRQRVHNYLPGYKVADDPQYLAVVSERLRKTYPASKIVCGWTVNGFFMMARTTDWWLGRFDRNHVFDPAKKMVGNEDELQARWKRKGFRIGFVPSSFVFHYRAVTRGEKHKHRDWYRLKE